MSIDEDILEEVTSGLLLDLPFDKEDANPTFSNWFLELERKSLREKRAKVLKNLKVRECGLRRLEDFTCRINAL